MQTLRLGLKVWLKPNHRAFPYTMAIMGTRRNWIIAGGQLREQPGWWKIEAKIEGDDERGFSCIRKADGTYWDIVGTDIFPRSGGLLEIELGGPIVDERHPAQCRDWYIRLLKKAADDAAQADEQT